MSNVTAFSELLVMIPMLVPMLTVCLVAMGLAVWRWHRAPRASLFCLIGFGTQLAMTLLAPFIRHYIFSVTSADGSPGQSRMIMLAVSGIAIEVIHAIALGMILAAVFVGHTKTVNAREPDATGTSFRE